MESNDSPEIQDRGETSDISGLPSGVYTKKAVTSTTKITIFIVSSQLQKKKEKKTVRINFLVYTTSLWLGR